MGSSESVRAGVPGKGLAGASPCRTCLLVFASALVAVLATVPARAGSVRLRSASDRKPVEIYLAPDPEPPRP